METDLIAKRDAHFTSDLTAIACSIATFSSTVDSRPQVTQCFASLFPPMTSSDVRINRPGPDAKKRTQTHWSANIHQDAQQDGAAMKRVDLFDYIEVSKTAVRRLADIGFVAQLTEAIEIAQ